MSRFQGVSPADRVAEDIATRIRRHILVTEGGCWEWQLARNRDGYGRIFVGSRRDSSRRTAFVHRVSYEAFVGPIPGGLVIDHLCRNPPCCNPDHLEPVTSRENTIVRGIGGPADQSRQVTCKRGHPLSGDNIWLIRGKRYCKTCKALRDA